MVVSFAEIERIQKGEPKKEGETYLDLFNNKNVRVKERVLIPVKQYPRVSHVFFFPPFFLLFGAFISDNKYTYVSHVT